MPNQSALGQASPLPENNALANAALPHSSREQSAPVPTQPIQSTGVHICVHGHFYQPPRENPYLDSIERQPSAEPFHDWNERIHHECYRPNAFARILNERGEVVRIVNTFEYISFNIGPTLMSWLERHDLATYQRILEADRNSAARLNGHGNAIAQVYNHMILPLANQRDQVTQIRWGKADFRSRFGRDPEGMWLAETAIDETTLTALVDEGIRFTILAPSQVKRCRSLTSENQATTEWQDVSNEQIDTTRPYRCFLKDGSGRYLDLFFYDGPISRDMGFSDVLSWSRNFVGRMGQAIRGDHRPSQLISVATDGETFGHHRHDAEKTLAYAITTEFPRCGWTVTNYAHYLSLHPPTWEAELKPVTAWSCAHGVDRWQEDCGCGGGGGWHQRWRRPLRDALDWLRDELIAVYDSVGARYFTQPWEARDNYIHVIRDRSSESVNRFLTAHQTHPLSAAERVDALRLLEMQRHALLMYTSCGWFFEELSRPEGTQILRYASRALELAGEVSGIHLEDDFMARLAQAPSNLDAFQDGAGVYRHQVSPSRISLEQVAAHYAISSLFTTYHREQRIYCYTIQQDDYRLQRMGSLTLAVGRISLTSEITHEKTDLAFAVLHLGGWDFHCCIQRFTSRLLYAQAKECVFKALTQASSAQAILAINRTFGDRAYSLQDLFAEDRHRIMQWLSQETLNRLNLLYTQVYRDNYGVLMAFHRDQLPVPQELQVAAEIALSYRATNSIRALEQETSDPEVNPLHVGMNHLGEMEAIAREARHFRCQLKVPTGKHTLEQLIQRCLWNLLQQFNDETSATDIEWLIRLIQLGRDLGWNLCLDQAQELYYHYLQTLVPVIDWQQSDKAQSVAGSYHAVPCTQLPLSAVRQLMALGPHLHVDVSRVITALVQEAGHSSPQSLEFPGNQ